MAVTILVLQTFASQGGASRGAANQETACLHVAGGPDEIPHTLETEHRVVDVERDHADAMVGVGRARGGERRHGAGLVDALLQHLPVFLVFAVIHQLVGHPAACTAALGRVDADTAGTCLPCRRCGLRPARSARCACRCSCHEPASVSIRTSAMVVDLALATAFKLGL